MRSRSALACSRSCSSLAARVRATVYLIPPPRFLAGERVPATRDSYSSWRVPPCSRCEWQSTRPGVTTLPSALSCSRAAICRWESSTLGPTSTITPPEIAIAASLITSRLLSSASPRRYPRGDRQVSSSPMSVSKRSVKADLRLQAPDVLNPCCLGSVLIAGVRVPEDAYAGVGLKRVDDPAD